MNTGREVGSSAELMARIAKGWQPNRYLTNMSMAFFANAGEYVATSIFPICPVELSTGYYYIYNKGNIQVEQHLVCDKPVLSPLRVNGGR